MSVENKGTCSTCSQKIIESEKGDPNDPILMNNNPISMLFNLGSTAVDVLKEYSRRGLLVTDNAIMDSRMEICSTCKMFSKESARCGLCGCFMKVKIRLAAVKCPLSKW
jgi:hypothetical protein